MSLPGLPPFSPRLVFSGRHITAPTPNGVANPGGPWFVAVNTGVVGTAAPVFWVLSGPGQEIYDVDPARAAMPSVYGYTLCKGDTNGVQDTVAQPRPGDGVCWQRRSYTASHPYIKNNFELKRGKDVLLQYNVLDWHGSMHNVNQQQAYMVAIKATGSLGNSTLLPNACADGLGFPECYHGETRNISIVNNILRGFSGGIVLFGEEGISGPPPSRNGNYLVRGNLLIQTERPHIEQYTGYRPLSVAENSPVRGGTRTIPLPDVRIENNTIYSPFVLPPTYVPMNFGAASNSGGFDGVRTLTGNIWARGTAGAVSSPGGTHDFGATQTTWFPGTNSGGVWGNNIILGAAAGAFPENLVWTGCSTTDACIRSLSDSMDWSSVFMNAEAGDFRLRDDQWGKRAMSDGLDAGADVSQLPEIRNLTITPSDRSVLFRYTVTEPIANIPCVVEVHTAPDFETPVWQGNPAGYAGELSDISNYHGQDSDDAPRNVRIGAERTLTVGYAVPLKPATTYFYRLHCGGDVRRGSFMTTDPAASETTQTISRVPDNPSTTMMEVEYGTSYDRNADAIAEARTAVSACTAGEPCSVSFPAAGGAVIYYRWRERDANGESLGSGNVSVLIAR
jgi:hypothetical protein